MERHVHDIRLTVKQGLKKENGAIKYRYIEEEQTIHWHKKRTKGQTTIYKTYTYN
jgi:hypothetical protein